MTARRFLLFGMAVMMGWLTLLDAQKAAAQAKRKDMSLCGGKGRCAGRDPNVKDIRILQENGARPHWSPSGDWIVFDRRDKDGFADLYLTDLQGNTKSLTAGKEGIAQRNNGNGIFHPSGKYIVFVSEEEDHMMERSKYAGDPGLGLFSNLWATTPEGSEFWQLTDIPIRKKWIGRQPVQGTVNPRFTPDGSKLIWTERYDKGGRWGKWRLKIADFVVKNGRPTLQNERVLFEPKTGNYVTATGFRHGRILAAGNLEGQHEYGMDLYMIDTDTGKKEKLVDTPRLWEEGACIGPKTGAVVFMTNAESRFEMDFKNPNWAAQPEERDYFILDPDTKKPRRLTFFNEPNAPEYLGGRNMVAVCSISPDGKYLAGTLGIDRSTGKKRDLQLKVVLIEFKNPI